MTMNHHYFTPQERSTPSKAHACTMSTSNNEQHSDAAGTLEQHRYQQSSEANSIDHRPTSSYSRQTQSRADQLSASLANLAREEQRVEREASRLPGGRRRAGEESSSCSSGSGSGDLANLDSRVPVVTGSTTTSSGDDRYPFGGNAAHQVSGSTQGAREESSPFLGYAGLSYHHRRTARQAERHGSDTLGLHVAHDEGSERTISHPSVAAKLPSPVRRLESSSRRIHHGPTGSHSDDSSADSSSESGTEDGYAGSVSDQQEVCSSPCASASEDGSYGQGQRVSFDVPFSYTNNGVGKRKYNRSGTDDSSSSIMADFSSGSMSGFDGSCISSALGENSYEEAGTQRRATKRKQADISELKKKDLLSDPMASLRSVFGPKICKATQRRYQTSHHAFAAKMTDSKMSASSKARHASSQFSTGRLLNGQPPIFSLNADTMAHMITFLEPPQVHSILTMPLSKQWTLSFTNQHELWRTLCVMEPFMAKFDNEGSSGEDNTASLSLNSGTCTKSMFGKFRLRYASYVRCMLYLNRIKDDAVHGRPPSMVDYGSIDMSLLNVSHNSSLKKFFSRAKGAAARARPMEGTESSRSNSPDLGARPVGVTDDARAIESLQSPPARKKPRVKYGHSTLTQRLLGPSQNGEAGNVNLPWSCAIYSIVNWMVAFSDVEGIQTMCLSVFPHILEDGGQRMTAQHAGLTDIVLRGMVLFPDSARLHTAAFHTIVLLARPLGGKEGMLFHSSMVNSSCIFDGGRGTGRNGIAVMLDSMQRFGEDASLQAMSCWSMVNIALAPSQKAVLVKLGGIGAIAGAMLRHPHDAEVQFRALFALINLVIPSVKFDSDSSEEASLQAQLGELNETSEKDMLDEHVSNIANLVVMSMKNFCSSESILNRACLVLHNLSLTTEYHECLLLTPNFYQMLEWCLANYRTDQVLQQSAAGTLHRLQTTLATDGHLGDRFASSLRSQQRTSLLQARNESLLLRDQQENERPENVQHAM